jgi:membrane protease subunit HflC
MRKKILIGLVVLVVVGLIGFSQSLYKVDETDYAVVLQFQEIQFVKTEPGLNFKLPFVQEVIHLDRRVLTSDTPPQEYLTSDEKRIVVDQITRWRIKGDDVRRFFLTNLNEVGGRSRLEPLVLAELRAQIAARLYDTMISAERDTIMGVVKDAVQLRVDEAGLGIEVLDVRTKRADLPAAVEQAVYDRMESARQVEADRHRATGQREADQIRSETDRNVAVMLACADRLSKEIRGDGEAAAIRIFAQALRQDPDFFSFIRRLEAYTSSFSGDDSLVMSTDSNFFRLLSGEVVPITEVEATQGNVVPLDEEDIRPLTAEEIDRFILECIPEEIQETAS